MNYYYQYNTIKSLEVEITSFCNAFCGDCLRNIRGGPTENFIRLKHIDIESWKKICTEENLKYIQKINFNGNVGDALMHPQFIELLDYLNSIKADLIITISTNGGARNAKFYTQLANSLQKFKYHKLNFAIDGDEETNHIYRRGVNWNKLMSNMVAFIEAGGNAFWKCIVFDYNKEKLEKISNIARDMGCVAFLTRRNRSLNPIIVDKYKNFNADIITSPSIEEFKSKYMIHNHFNYDKVMDKESREELYNFEKIYSDDYFCPFASERMASIDNYGNLWPCCFIYDKFVANNESFPIQKYLDNNSLLKFNLPTILEFFRNDLNESWENKSYNVCNKCLHKSNPPLSASEATYP